MTLVTIGITAYNAEETIESAVESAVRQSGPEKEILIVDDASTDKTKDILRALQDLYTPQVRIILSDVNMGVAAARNRLIKEASGDFLIFFDDDDISVPHRVACQLNQIREWEEYFGVDSWIVSHAARIQIPDRGGIRYIAPLGVGHPQKAPKGADVARWILTGSPLISGRGAGATCSQMARLSTYRFLQGFDPSFRRSEDTDLNIRLGRVGGFFAGIEEPLVYQRITKGSDKSAQIEDEYQKKYISKHRDFINLTSDNRHAYLWIDLKRFFYCRKYKNFIFLGGYLLIRYPILTWQRGWNAVVS